MREMSIGEKNYEGNTTSIRSDICRFSTGAIAARAVEQFLKHVRAGRSARTENAGAQQHGNESPHSPLRYLGKLPFHLRFHFESNR